MTCLFAGVRERRVPRVAPEGTVACLVDEEEAAICRFDDKVELNFMFWSRLRHGSMWGQPTRVRFASHPRAESVDAFNRWHVDPAE
jgi:hypothetical protein